MNNQNSDTEPLFANRNVWRYIGSGGISGVAIDRECQYIGSGDRSGVSVYRECLYIGSGGIS